MKEIDVKFFTVIILIINKCYAKYSNVCDTCICQTKPNENILHVNCTETPKFEKLVDLKSFDKSDVHLSLEYMNLTSIQRYTKFEGLNVKTISLDNNYIKTIPPYIFSKYSNLTTLSLANNDIDEISEDSFGGLTELKTLNISYNALKTFDTIYINDLKKLEALDLRGNSLFNLPSTSILQKINLNYLDMSENKLTNFPEKTFKLFTELKYLDLSHNQIKELPKQAFEMQNILEKLFISKNRLADIHSEAFPDVNLIKVFNINHNLISNTDFIKKLTSLTELDLSFNSISSLNTMAWSHSLVTLLVGNNGLTSLDDILKGLPQLKKLDASWNQCSKLPSIINSNLKELILDANGISSLPPRSPGSGALTYLSLSEIPHLTKLQKGCFNGVFSSNITAEPCARLEIVKTNLKSIEKGALTNSNICEINLSWNELTSLPQDTFDWERIKTLDLQGNPWDCSCSMQWLLDKVVAKMYDHHQELLQNLRCSTPKTLQATRLVHWFNKTEPMLCSKENLKEANFITISSSPAMIVLVVVFGVIVVALVATGFYLQRQIIKQRRRSKNRRF